MVYLYNGILYNNEKKGSIAVHNYVDESQGHNDLWKNPVTRVYILCHSSYIKFKNRKKWFIVLEDRRVVTLGRSVLTGE